MTVDGTVVASQEQTVSAGDNATVTLVGDTSGLSAGEYDLSVASNDDSDSATLTVEGDTTGEGIPERYDANDNGTIELGELATAAGDYSDGEIDLQDLSLVAGAYSDS
jgi:hypothetical protein